MALPCIRWSAGALLSGDTNPWDFVCVRACLIKTKAHKWPYIAAALFEVLANTDKGQFLSFFCLIQFFLIQLNSATYFQCTPFFPLKG